MVLGRWSIDHQKNLKNACYTSIDHFKTIILCADSEQDYFPDMTNLPRGIRVHFSVEANVSAMNMIEILVLKCTFIELF